MTSVAEFPPQTPLDGSLNQAVDAQAFEAQFGAPQAVTEGPAFNAFVKPEGVYGHGTEHALEYQERYSVFNLTEQEREDVNGARATVADIVGRVASRMSDPEVRAQMEADAATIRTTVEEAWVHQQVEIAEREQRLAMEEAAKEDEDDEPVAA